MYRWLNHTGEAELAIEAATEEDVFREAAAGLRELLAAGGDGEPSTRSVTVDAADRPALLAEWLGELAFLAETEGFVADRVEALELEEARLRATVSGRTGQPAPPREGGHLPWAVAGPVRRGLARDGGARCLTSSGSTRRSGRSRWSERPDMRVPARVFADAELLDAIRQDLSLEQLANVATLPGIVGAALAMPDIHQGYGFPVGGVAAFEAPDGIVSPGGVGYDINCGVRLLALPLTETELNGRREAFVHELSRAIPAGMGKPGQLRLRGADLDRVLREGPRALVERGIGTGGRHRAHGVSRLPSRSRPCRRVRARQGARRRSAGHRRLREPLHRGAARLARSRPGRRPRPAA